MKLFYPNLAFEDQLTVGSNKATSASLKAVSELAPLMAWAGDESSFCVVPEKPDVMPKACVGQCVVDSEFAGDVAADLEPWGWNQPAIQFAKTKPFIRCDAPDLSAVRSVNSRSFLNQFDEAMNLGDGTRQMFSHLCYSLDEVSHTVKQLQAVGWQKWAAKPELSHAGRNRLIVTGVELNQQQTGWLRRHFVKGEAVCIEPWVSVVEEGSLHFEIPSDTVGTVQQIGITGLVNDAAGRYRGSFKPLKLNSVSEDSGVVQLLMNHGQRICNAIQQVGYWGPVGLDFFIYEDAAGQLFLRLCNDLNARWTMGRLSLEVADRVGAVGEFRWEHFVTGNSAILDRAIEKGLTESGQSSVDILRTSPDHVGGRNVRLGNVAIWEPLSQNADFDSVQENSGVLRPVDSVARQIRLSLQELMFEKSSQ